MTKVLCAEWKKWLSLVRLLLALSRIISPPECITVTTQYAESSLAGLDRSELAPGLVLLPALPAFFGRDEPDGDWHCLALSTFGKRDPQGTLSASGAAYSVPTPGQFGWLHIGRTCGRSTHDWAGDQSD